MQSANAMRTSKIIEEVAKDQNPLDKDKVEVKKQEGLKTHQEIKENKQKLKELSDKASLMFQNIKDIQKIMNESFVGLDKSV